MIMFEGMSTSRSGTNLNYGQPRGASPTASRPTSSHATVGPLRSSSPVHAAGAYSVNLKLPAPVPAQDEALQMAIQEYVRELSDNNKAAFQSAPNIIEHLHEM